VRSHTVRVLLTAPAFLYLGALLLSRFTGWTAVVSAAFFLMLVSNFTTFLPAPWGRYFQVGLLGLSIGTALLLLLPGAGSVELAAELAAGYLLGSPFLLIGWVCTSDRGPGRTFVTLQLALVDALTMLAALAALQAGGYPTDAVHLIAAYVQVLFVQANGLLGLLTGAGGPLPLRDVLDTTFLLLVGLAVLGSLVPLLEPRTGRDSPLPLEEAGTPVEVPTLLPGDWLPLRPELREILAHRSQPRPPSFGRHPGLFPLFVAALMASLFATAAYFEPGEVLLPLVLGALGTLVLASYHYRPRGPTRTRGGTPTTASPRPPPAPGGTPSLPMGALPPSSSSPPPLAPPGVGG
jgi:hypothetical protein